jgi:hypothetical protein
MKLIKVMDFFNVDFTELSLLEYSNFNWSMMVDHLVCKKIEFKV